MKPLTEAEPAKADALRMGSSFIREDQTMTSITMPGGPGARPLRPRMPGRKADTEKSGLRMAFAGAEFLPPSVRCLDRPDEHQPPVKALTNGRFACEAGHRTGASL